MNFFLVPMIVKNCKYGYALSSGSSALAPV
jgi:hypothetical protein